MSRIVLVRHGETIWHAENRYAGRSDVALSSCGLRQAQMLAKWAANAGLSAIWSSPLSRARLTAGPAAEAAGVPLRIDDRLVELDFGLCEGLTEQEMRNIFPQERAAFMKDPVANFLPGGEDPIAAVRRGTEVFRHIASNAEPDSRVLVVAHNTLLRLVLCEVLGIPISRYRRTFPAFANGALTEICLTAGHTSLLSYNVPLQT